MKSHEKWVSHRAVAFDNSQVIFQTMFDDQLIYNKLVRDRIVDIVRSKGKVPTYRTLNEREFEHHLKLKLIEECHELFRAESNEDFLKEAADILEVLHTIAAVKSVDWSDLLGPVVGPS